MSQPTPTAPPSPSSSNGNNSNASPTSNSLYLFTFLTTLLLLLAVSCGIVLRSFILRRRFRRRVEAAIAAGVLLPEQVDALRRRGPAIGERPTMWEARIGKGGANAAVVGAAEKPGYEYPMSGADTDSFSADDWANVMPVSAAIIPASSKKNSSNSPPAPVPVPQPDVQTTPSPQRPLWSRLRKRSNDSGSVLPMTAPPPPPNSVPGNLDENPRDLPAASGAPSTPAPEPQDKLQLTVLISMPNANQRRYLPSMSASQGDRNVSPVGSEKGKEQGMGVEDEDEDEEEIPEVVFGITEVLWDAGADWQPRETSVGKAEETEASDGQTGSAV